MINPVNSQQAIAEVLLHTQPCSQRAPRCFLLQLQQRWRFLQQQRRLQAQAPDWHQPPACCCCCCSCQLPHD
jgi:hypothetical protein